MKAKEEHRQVKTGCQSEKESAHAKIKSNNESSEETDHKLAECERITTAFIQDIQTQENTMFDLFQREIQQCSIKIKKLQEGIEKKSREIDAVLEFKTVDGKSRDREISELREQAQRQAEAHAAELDRMMAHHEHNIKNITVRLNRVIGASEENASKKEMTLFTAAQLQQYQLNRQLKQKVELMHNSYDLIMEKTRELEKLNMELHNEIVEVDVNLRYQLESEDKSGGVKLPFLEEASGYSVYRAISLSNSRIQSRDIIEMENKKRWNANPVIVKGNGFGLPANSKLGPQGFYGNLQKSCCTKI
jgi:hypothetical protein